MKKTLAIGVAVIGLAAGAYAQGIVQFMNTDNTSSSLTATANGLVFINGSLLKPTDTTFNIELLGGATSTGLSLLASDIDGSQSILLKLNSNPGGAGNGTFLDASGGNFIIPGATGTAYFQVLAWTGNATTYAAALNDANALVASTVVFQNAIVPQGSTTFVPTLTGMPALNLVAVPTPEPGTFALAGLGAAAMMIFRRRK